MYTLPLCIWTLITFFNTFCYCEREHKVHNIVLYPEKHSWCQTTQIQQVVSAPGYEPVTIENNVCVGACFSYSIPKSEPAEPGELIGPYCDSCQPAEIKCYHVNLYANPKNIDEPKILQKRVQIIMNCSCQSCDKIRSEDCAINDTNTLELPKHLYVNQDYYGKTNDDVIHPDLFDAQNSRNKQHIENDIKLKNKLKKWFEDYQNESGENNKANEMDDINNNSNAIDKQYHQKNNDIIMDTHSNEIVDDNNNNKHHTHSHSHPHQHQHSHTQQHHHSQQSHQSHQHHNHHLGDEQYIGTHIDHLIRGPHGSMAAAPTEIKLHIDDESDSNNNDEIKSSSSSSSSSSSTSRSLTIEDQDSDFINDGN